ncbi:general odorant-binding protein 84a-like [Manduca sexta]|uniref:general odorant-binding protein 84a-like n=1 Tax=Manduca sexta TaxID=7130 RepID=UPI0018900415|nr:general odorant-binding protein 84a-like [Manduca sexta]
MCKPMYYVVFSIIYLSIVLAQKADNGNTKIANVQRNDQGSMDDVDVEDIMNQCNETFRIEMAYLQALNESGSFPDETDRTPKCFLLCVLDNTGVMTKDGDFDPERTAALFAGERAGKVMDGIQDMAAACADRKEKCKCEKSYNYLKCLMTMEIEKYANNN